MTTNPEITIPSLWGDILWQIFGLTIVLVFSALAVFDLANGDAIVASGIWLALVALRVWPACREAGGPRPYLIDRLGAVAGRHFAEIHCPDDQPVEVNFGYELLGHRFIQHAIPLGRIARVEWSPGQATAKVGRDMNDWCVYLWYDHDDPAKARTRRTWTRQADQEFYEIGPSRRKDDTEAFGLKLVAMLRAAGAPLVQDEKDTCFVRKA